MCNPIPRPQSAKQSVVHLGLLLNIRSVIVEATPLCIQESQFSTYFYFSRSFAKTIISIQIISALFPNVHFYQVTLRHTASSFCKYVFLGYKLKKFPTICHIYNYLFNGNKIKTVFKIKDIVFVSILIQMIENN